MLSLEIMKVVIIGVSGHVDLAYSVRAQLPEVRFAGIAPGSKDEDATAIHRAHLQELGAALYDDYRTMLEKEKPDAAVIAPVFNLQSPIAVDCFERGIHVFLEKPMALSLEELGKLKRAHQRASIRLMPILSYRYEPEFWAAYCAVKDGRIGEPLIITAQKSYKLGNREWYYRTRSTYGGTIPWVGIHAIDLVHWFTGGRIVDVYARHTTRDNGGCKEMESSAVCVYGLENSGSAIVSSDYFQPASSPSHGDDRIRIGGGKGVVEVRDREAFIATHEMPRQKLAKEPPVSIFVDFIRSIEGKATPRISAEEAFEVSELALKSREAADTGRVVRFR